MPPKPKAIVVPAYATPQTNVWVEIRDKKDIEPIEYLSATVVNIDAKQMATVMFDDPGAASQTKFRADRLLEKNQKEEIIDDLVNIEPLNDAELLVMLKRRFEKDLIYVNCGPTLIMTNPYKRIDGIASEEKRLFYRNFALNGGDLDSLPPHIWALAAKTFWQLFENRTKQAICISGESGAGKTFGTKLCMGFMTAIFPSEESETVRPIEDRILGCNPILEAFGNSKTVRNDNSSRFGKYFMMKVDRADKNIKGALIQNYLLEKSRIVQQSKTERNYHIFYAICQYLPPDQLVKYKLAEKGKACNMNSFEYLNKSGCLTWPTIDDKEFYDDVMNSFNTLGFEKDEQDTILRMISCVLLMGNVPIDSSNHRDGSNACTLANNQAFANVCELLGIDGPKISEGCCVKITSPGGQIMKSFRSPAECQSIRDAFAKDIFNNMFNWIVRKLNVSLDVTIEADFTTVGLLDIFGFEFFEINSLEQFCINYTNEKIQNLYISYVFKGEENIFREEGLQDHIGLIEFTDNEPIMKIMDANKNPPGIFSSINQACALNKDDNYLVNDIIKNHSKNDYFFVPKFSKVKFGVKHTARPGEYYGPGFIEKNKDELPSNLVDAICEGERLFSRIFQVKLTDDEVDPNEGAKKDPKEKYLGYKFQKEMQALMTELLSCECNFCRCIKPNEDKKANFWINSLGLLQVRYLGILDSINVRKMSLPVRKKYEIFYEKFQDLDEISPERSIIIHELKKQNPNWPKLSKNAVKSAFPDAQPSDVLFGKTRVFMSQEFDNKMQKALIIKQKVKRDAVVIMSRTFKHGNFKNRWDRYRKRAINSSSWGRTIFQSWQSKLEYNRFKKIIETVRHIQLNFRSIKLKRRIRLCKHTTEVICNTYKIQKMRQMFLKINKVQATLIRCKRVMCFRALQVRVKWMKQIRSEIFEKAWKIIMIEHETNAALTMERIFRGWSARNQVQEEVEQLKLIKEQVKETRAATCVQKHAKGFIVRNRLDRLNRAAGFIQGYARMTWLSDYFQLLRKSVRIIQRAVRKYQLINQAVESQMVAFLQRNKNYVKELKRIEHDAIFFGEEGLSEQQHLEALTNLNFFDKGLQNSLPEVSSFIPENQGMELNPKIKLFSTLVDLDCRIDTSDIYAASWAVDYLKLLKMIHKNKTRLMHVEIGESFSLALNDDLKMFSWGLNDCSQLGRPQLSSPHPEVIRPFNNTQPKVLSAGDNHAIMLDYNGDVFAWGSNDSGQLGLGHSRNIQGIINLSHHFGKTPIKTVQSNGKQSYVLNEEGRLYNWPASNRANRFEIAPVPISHLEHRIQNISVGRDFLLCLTVNGLVYSKGDNRFGQLGLPRVTTQGLQGSLTQKILRSEQLQLVEVLKNLGEKVVEVSAGHKHSICRSATGKAYTWGLNDEGQLGHGNRTQLSTPTLVKIPDCKGAVTRVKSVQAGFGNSYILMEDRRLFRAGATADLGQSENIYFDRLYYEDKVFGGKLKDEFTPLKLYCKWSTNLSIAYIVFADCRDVKESKTVRDKTSNHVNSKWDDNYYQVLPPYDEVSSKLIGSKYLKRDKNTLDSISGTPLKKSAASSKYSSVQKSSASRPQMSPSRASPVKPFALSSAKKSPSPNPRRVTKRV